MDQAKLRWIFLIALAIIWGSSFILMKKALLTLSPVQVGALRILITALFLILIGFKRLLKIRRRHWYYLVLNGFAGTFFPVFLFAFAMDKIDSSIGAILNSLTPLNTLILGALIFGFGFKKRQLIGVCVGLAGTLILIMKGAELNPGQDYFYASFILISSIGYALNVNILKKYLHDLDALSIAVGNFVLFIIPAFIILWLSNFFTSVEAVEGSLKGMMYVTVLAVLGTGVAKIMFNKLIHMSTPVFSSSVTYLIPIVAVAWGINNGEKISAVQFMAGGIILLGVYIVNRAK